MSQERYLEGPEIGEIQVVEFALRFRVEGGERRHRVM